MLCIYMPAIDRSNDDCRWSAVDEDGSGDLDR